MKGIYKAQYQHVHWTNEYPKIIHVDDRLFITTGGNYSFPTSSNFDIKICLGLIHNASGPAINNYIYYYYGEWLSKEDWFEALTSEEKQNYIWNLDNE